MMLFVSSQGKDGSKGEPGLPGLPGRQVLVTPEVNMMKNDFIFGDLFMTTPIITIGLTNSSFLLGVDSEKHHTV